MKLRSVLVCAGTAVLLVANPIVTANARSGSALSTASTERLAKLRAAVADGGRTPANVTRDRYRHPVETLDFFEVDPAGTAME